MRLLFQMISDILVNYQTRNFLFVSGMVSNHFKVSSISEEIPGWISYMEYSEMVSSPHQYEPLSAL